MPGPNYNRGQVVLAWFRRGLNTNEIAKKMHKPEYEIERLLHHARDNPPDLDGWGRDLNLKGDT